MDLSRFYKPKKQYNPQEPKKQYNPQEPKRLEPPSEKILIIEDDPDCLDRIRMGIRAVGIDWEILEAINGNKGLELYQQYQPRVLVLDQMLPGKSGFLILTKLQKDINERKTYPIMITANPGPRHEQYAETLGVRAYLKKPFKVKDLISKIQDGMRERVY